ncbi:hypothetical protein C8A00DRAFT_42028 [Chaetomidium leptoderma]|uniref:Suppressor of anucleate metulae protein B n=1 Tax=Chaetomidium leptoderma TaxID=669021 RepID=A0AAN6VQE8_9PEZI|nr:hypothetical protein C8A00DRAFT_42028 [Chaetomidium leptoderma]
MATDRPTDNGDDEDFTPSPREALHLNAQLSQYNLGRVVSAVPLEIRSSDICDGSGLFVSAEIDAGREIYHVHPLTGAIYANNKSFCHHCCEDTQDVLGGPSKAALQTKACTGCRAARFCSKECQKSAWPLYHKEECKLLQKAPNMTAQNLITHRLLFWHRRGGLSKQLAASLLRLETHFADFNKDDKRATELHDIAVAIQEALGTKVALTVPWRLVAAMRINCVRLRPASRKESVGYAVDICTAMINHSCDPNAFVFFEGRQLRIRSLKKIAAGEEVTICYLDPTLDVAARKALLKHEYFFDCYCNRCKSEIREQRSLLGGSNELSPLHQAQREVLGLINSAVRASNYPGIYAALEDLPAIETGVRTITAGAFPPEKPWPEHMEPLPSARLALAMLYLGQGKPVAALRNALKGKLLSTRTDGGPDWVNEMLDVVTVLIVAGSLPPDAPAFADTDFPSVDDIRNVAYGYLLKVSQRARKAFGRDSEYARGISSMAVTMAAKKAGAVFGGEEFVVEFEPAQRKVLAWAGVPEENGICLA